MAPGRRKPLPPSPSFTSRVVALAGLVLAAQVVLVVICLQRDARYITAPAAAPASAAFKHHEVEHLGRGSSSTGTGNNNNNNNTLSVIIEGHSLRRACLQRATNTQNSKPRPAISLVEIGFISTFAYFIDVGAPAGAGSLLPPPAPPRPLIARLLHQTTRNKTGLTCVDVAIMREWHRY